jgi:hypothetical protein
MLRALISVLVSQVAVPSHQSPAPSTIQGLDSVGAARKGEAGLQDYRALICSLEDVRKRKHAIEAAFIFSRDPVTEVRQAIQRLKSCSSNDLVPFTIQLLRGFPSHRAYSAVMALVRDPSAASGVGDASLTAALEMVQWPVQAESDICRRGNTHCAAFGYDLAAISFGFVGENRLSVPAVAVDDPLTKEEVGSLTMQAMVAAMTSESSETRGAAMRRVQSSWRQTEQFALEAIARDDKLPREARRAAALGWSFNRATQDAWELRKRSEFAELGIFVPRPGSPEHVTRPAHLEPSAEGVYRVDDSKKERILVKAAPVLDVRIPD